MVNYFVFEKNRILDFVFIIIGIIVQHIDDFHRRWRQLTSEK
jgi:hypothetical protein